MIRKEVRKTLSLASKFFQENLEKASPNSNRLKFLLDTVGLRRKTIELFEVGFAPSHSSSLANEVSRKNLDLKLSEHLGLIIKDNTGKYHDQLCNRIMIPLKTEEGETFGFLSRSIEKHGLDTYRATPNYGSLKKSDHLFALDLAKQKIREKDRVILVESVWECMALHQLGFTETVGIIGLFLSPAQTTLLLQHTRNVFLLFEKDGPGQKILGHALKTLKVMRANMKIIQIQKRKDVLDFIQSSDANSIEKTIWQARHC